MTRLAIIYTLAEDVLFPTKKRTVPVTVLYMEQSPTEPPSLFAPVDFSIEGFTRNKDFFIT